MSASKLQALAGAANALWDHALVYASGDINDEQVKRKHLQLADEYARAKWAAATGSTARKDARPSTSSLQLRFGRSKGKTLGEAPSGDLRWCLERLEEDVGNPDKARWQADNKRMLDAIRAELEQRGEL